MTERIRSLGPTDWLFAGVVAFFVVLVLLPWWSTKLLPLMDYPMFLSFVRVFFDHDEPGSPFHGTYTLGPPISPLVLPITIVAALSKLGSIELGGRIAWTLYALALPASAYYLLRALGQSRWNVLLAFPLVFGKWTSSGFFGFVTGMPLLLLTWGVAIRFLSEPTWKRGVAVSVCLAALVEWHAVLTAQALLGLGILWLCWHAPSIKDRFKQLWPVAAPGVLIAIWVTTEFASATKVPAKGSRLVWQELPQMFDTQMFFSRILMLYPNADVIAKVFVLLLVGILLFGPRERRFAEERSLTAGWHVKNPMAIIAFVALVCFFIAPAHVLPAEVIGQRFGWMAAVFLVPAWSWPKATPARVIAITLVAGLSGFYLVDVFRRFRAYHLETVGASRLIDSIPNDATLLAPMKNNETESFMNHPIREIQQYATIRNGVLPTTSFAGYGVNYVRFVDKNPKPQLFPHTWLGHRGLTEFDYVLLRNPSPAESGHRRLRFVKSDGAWQLFEVCGSKKRPKCD